MAKKKQPRWWLPLTSLGAQVDRLVEQLGPPPRDVDGTLELRVRALDENVRRLGTAQNELAEEMQRVRDRLPYVEFTPRFPEPETEPGIESRPWTHMGAASDEMAERYRQEYPATPEQALQTQELLNRRPGACPGRKTLTGWGTLRCFRTTGHAGSHVDIGAKYAWADEFTAGAEATAAEVKTALREYLARQPDEAAMR